MASNTIVINGELAQLLRETDCVPEENAVKILAADGANQLFHKRMRYWGVDNRVLSRNLVEDIKQHGDSST